MAVALGVGVPVRVGVSVPVEVGEYREVGVGVPVDDGVAEGDTVQVGVRGLLHKDKLPRPLLKSSRAVTRRSFSCKSGPSTDVFPG